MHLFYLFMSECSGCCPVRCSFIKICFEHNAKAAMLSYGNVLPILKLWKILAKFVNPLSPNPMVT